MLIGRTMGYSNKKCKIVAWVHKCISTPSPFHTSYNSINHIERMIVRYQCPVVSCKGLKEIESWNNKVLLNDCKSYASDTGFFAVEYLYERRNEQWVQKEFRISADWEGLTDQVQKMHHSYGRLGGRKIRREGPH